MKPIFNLTDAYGIVSARIYVPDKVAELNHTAAVLVFRCTPSLFLPFEGMRELGINDLGHVCKNFFVRDSKGKNHYLVVLSEEKKADLKDIAAQIGSTPLSFSSEECLQKHLGVEKGMVTPLAIVNDAGHAVTVVFDKSLNVYTAGCSVAS